jgi:S-adenosylmethionine-diacylgycerolhomoserine-N-methlytransferase
VIETDSHAALMDGVYRHQRYVYDFTRKYYLLGRDRLIRDLALQPGERLIEIGCGTARNLILMAERYPGAEFFGLDASAQMLETAAEAIVKAGLSHRIRLAQGLAEQLEPSLFGLDRPFDRAIFSYSLSMIPQWKQALGVAGQSLSASGRAHIVDFGDFAGLAWPLAGLLRAWLGLFHVEPRSGMLRAIELRNHIMQENSDFWVLPGRYAFGWSCRGKDVLSLSL